MSLRARLLAGMAFVAVVLAVVAIVITATTRSLLIDQIDARLAAFSPGGRVTATVGAGSGPVLSSPPPNEPAGFPDRASDAYEGVVTADGTLVTRFTPNVGDTESAPPDLDPDDLPTAGTTSFTTDSIDGATTYRVLAQRFGDSVAITALPIDDVQDTISSLIRVEVIGALMILAALGLVSWWMVHLGIRPIKKMTATATRIAGGDLTVRVPETADGTESAELAVALNQMLGHIEGALEERANSEDRLRRFVADASHELRTPVTTIRGYAELYRLGGLAEADALDDAMRRTEQEATRMGRLVEDMLVLARLDEHRPLANAPVDLAALVCDASNDARATWPERVITARGVDEPAIVAGDEDRLRQVLANVVGNALVHTDAAGLRRTVRHPRRRQRRGRSGGQRRGHATRRGRPGHGTLLPCRPGALTPSGRERPRPGDRRCRGRRGRWRSGDRDRRRRGNDRAAHPAPPERCRSTPIGFLASASQEVLPDDRPDRDLRHPHGGHRRCAPARA